MDTPDLYPAIEPHTAGFLPVSGGHRVYYEVCGNPEGRPAVYLHGGPGAGCNPNLRRFFDPAAYRIILFDQRGAGRSTPAASLENNTTRNLIADMEALRNHLGVRRWLVLGGSWGSTLALVYAAAHPDACRALVLRGVWLCRRADLRWWFFGRRKVYPDHWREFAQHVPAAERADLLKAYFQRLIHPDPGVHMPAAVAWRTYETRCDTLLPRENLDIPANTQTLAIARLEAHYKSNMAFLAEGELLDGVPRFRHIPGVIIHGRYDMSCSLDGAMALSDAWPEAAFSIVADAGHSAMEPGIRERLVAATDRFRDITD
ncbi:MAG TPA: prolyl aminopeptidase [Gammaproteobacteria bacterium]|nr:prolyl aminopeptidase [Gammaproteobacteria bacterium]